MGLLALQMKLDEVDKDQLEVLHKPLWRLEDAHLVRAAPANAICVSGWVLGCCSHASMIPARGTYVCAADANMGLQLTGIFGYRLAGRIVGTSPAILRSAIARATPIM
ncbi:MAG TPA: hypothetical protein VI194_10805 [Mycobacterium sp.]